MCVPFYCNMLKNRNWLCFPNFISQRLWCVFCEILTWNDWRLAMDAWNKKAKLPFPEYNLNITTYFLKKWHKNAQTFHLFCRLEKKLNSTSINHFKFKHGQPVLWLMTLSSIKLLHRDKDWIEPSRNVKYCHFLHMTLRWILPYPIQSRTYNHFLYLVSWVVPCWLLCQN